MVTKLSNEERKKVVEGFYAKVMDGFPAAKDWVKNMVEASIPELPEDATAEQLDAWVELATILEDPSFVASMRAGASDFWSNDVDLVALEKIRGEFLVAAAEARGRGVDPSSEEATAFVRRFIGKMAAFYGESEERVTERMRAQYDRRAREDDPVLLGRGAVASRRAITERLPAVRRRACAPHRPHPHPS